MVLSMSIDAIVLRLSREAWDVFQDWPKVGPESDDGRPVEFIPEKSNGFNKLIGMFLSQANKSKGDADFRNSVIGESGLRGCATPPGTAS